MSRRFWPMATGARRPKRMPACSRAIASETRISATRRSLNGAVASLRLPLLRRVTENLLPNTWTQSSSVACRRTAFWKGTSITWNQFRPSHPSVIAIQCENRSGFESEGQRLRPCLSRARGTRLFFLCASCGSVRASKSLRLARAAPISNERAVNETRALVPICRYND